MYVSALKRIWSYHGYAACSALAEIIKTCNVWVVVYVGLRLQMLAWHKHIKCQCQSIHMSLWQCGTMHLKSCWALPFTAFQLMCGALDASWPLEPCKTQDAQSHPTWPMHHSHAWWNGQSGWIMCFWFFLKIVFYKISFVYSIKPTKSVIE